MLSDCGILQSRNGLVPQKLPEGMSIMASTMTVGWRNIHAVILEGRVEKLFQFSAPFPVIGFNLKGVTTLEWKRGSRFSRMHVQPGELLIAPAGDDQSVRSSHPSVGLLCSFDPARLRSLAEQEWDLDGSTIEIVETYNRDAELWDLGRRLAARLRSPILGSRLFAETLYTQIAIELLSRHSSLPRPSQAKEKLADPRLSKVIDYLHDSLGDDISLDGLAQVAGLSPHYFISAFRRSTGRTPHTYLTELRIARACQLLQDPYRSIVDISLAVGFSSQIHLTSVFGRVMKTTPAAYRADVLGLHPDGAGPRRRNGLASESGSSGKLAIKLPVNVS